MPVDVLLCHALLLARDPVERRLMTPYFPLGILYLAATLRQAGYSVALYDACFQPDLERFRGRAGRAPAASGGHHRAEHRARQRPAIWRRAPADAAYRSWSAARTRRAGPSTISPSKSVDGLWWMWWSSARARRRCWSWCRRCSSLPGARALADIPGIAYRRDGEPVTNPPRPLRKDIDAIPLPARDLADLDAYQRAWRQAHGYSSLSVIASRGCPFNCAWCQKSVFGRSCRLRDPEAVAAEIAQVTRTYHPDQLRIVDDVVGIDRRWVKRFRDAILSRGTPATPSSVCRASTWWIASCSPGSRRRAASASALAPSRARKRCWTP